MHLKSNNLDLIQKQLGNFEYVIEYLSVWKIYMFLMMPKYKEQKCYENANKQNTENFLV